MTAAPARWPTSIDYAEAMQSPETSFRDPALQNAKVVTNNLGLPQAFAGNFADVYQLQSADGTQNWAIKCFTKKVTGLRERYSEISRHLDRARLPLTVGFEYLEAEIRIRGEWYPILKMEWVSGFTLRDFVQQNLKKPRQLDVLLQVWLKVEPGLRQAQVTHGDLQHGNIMLVPGANERTLLLKLIDYDGLWVPALADQPPREVGHAAYQHPRRARQNLYTSDVDRFPHLVIACALKCLSGPRGAELWKTYDTGDNLLFTQPDFENPAKSKLLQELWASADPELRAWAGHLAVASQSPLEATPLLSKLYESGRLPPLSKEQTESAQSILGLAAQADTNDESRLQSKKAAQPRAIEKSAPESRSVPPPTTDATQRRAEPPPDRVADSQNDDDLDLPQKSLPPLRPRKSKSKPKENENTSLADMLPGGKTLRTNLLRLLVGGGAAFLGLVVILWALEFAQSVRRRYRPQIKYSAAESSGGSSGVVITRTTREWLDTYRTYDRGGARELGQVITKLKSFLGPDPAAIPDLFDALQEEKSEISAIAEAVLGKFTAYGPAVETEDLQPYFNHPNPKVRRWAEELRDLQLTPTPDSGQNPIARKPPPSLKPPFDSTAARATREAWAKYLSEPGEFKNNINMTMILIPPGEFVMGSPPDEVHRQENEAQAKVTLSQPFWLGQLEVTQAQWEQVMRTTPWKATNANERPAFPPQTGARTPKATEGPAFPASHVSWDDALDFCRKLTESEQSAGRLPQGWEYALPTEAQWEFACRAGTTGRHSFGNDDRLLLTNAWIHENTGDVGKHYGQRGGQHRGNDFGLHDMHGNMAEWCRDSYVEKLSDATDPDPQTPDSSRVLRGGGWGANPPSYRSALRNSTLPTNKGGDIGFRVALVPAQSAQAAPGSSPGPNLANPKSVPTPTPTPTTPSLAANKAPRPPALKVPFSPVQAQAAQQAWARHTGESAEMTADNDLKLILIPPGEFLMGSPADEPGRQPNESQAAVTLSLPYWLGKYEVTQAQWVRVMQTTPWKGREFVKEGPEFPASGMNWASATEFCQRLTQSERQAGRLTAEWTYALPTEAQWEYACRAGTTTPYSFGSSETELNSYAWNSLLQQTPKEERHAHAVGKKNANPLGLHDLCGNVNEWCRDSYVAKLGGGGNPEVNFPGSDRVFRGGSWNSEPASCRSAYRFPAPVETEIHSVGFRIARVPSPDSKQSPSLAVSPDAPESPRPPLPKGTAPEPIVNTILPRPALLNTPVTPLDGQTAQKAWAKYLGETPELTNGIDIDLVLIPPGRFVMGSLAFEPRLKGDSPQVEVTLSQPYWIGKYEVTQGEWKAGGGTNLWRERTVLKDGRDYPATVLSWDHATDFCQKLTESEQRAGRLNKNWKYALPTEAQWEYACRAGTVNLYCFGDADYLLDDYAWFTAGTRERKKQTVHEVGKKRSNFWGLHDVHGNVWEWCRDSFTSRLPGGTDPDVQSASLDRVYRGGSCIDPAALCRSAVRHSNPHNNRQNYGGFRIALVPTPEWKPEPNASPTAPAASSVTPNPSPQPSAPQPSTPQTTPLDEPENNPSKLAASSSRLPPGAGKIDPDAPKTFTKTKSGLKYRILRKGSKTAVPKITNSVEFHYHGWLADGKVFDSTYTRNATLTVSLNALMPGMKEGLQLIGQGGMIELEIPSNLGYGPRGAPPSIPPNATLHYVVEVVNVR